MPKNWKYIKKLLEKEFLCKKLRGHITYDLTDYRPAPWYQQHFIIKYDDSVLLNVEQPERAWDKRYSLCEVNWQQRENIRLKVYEKYELAQYDIPRSVMDSVTETIIGQTCALQSHHAGIYGVHDIIDAIGIYLHSNIEDSLKSEDPFIRVLATLDRRTGKRRLRKLAEQRWIFPPEWTKRFYRLRFETEGIKYTSAYCDKEK